MSKDRPTSSSPAAKQAEPPRPDKIHVEFIEPDGQRRRITVLLGQRLLDGALDAGVKGITGQCGGAINCATCLCDIALYDIAEASIDRLPPQHPDEIELLQWVDEASTNSRLSCQLIATEALEGLVLRVVPTL